ncbi:MAG TPA: hypothetical protein VGB85_00840 [Nannocystis sp.]
MTLALGCNSPEYLKWVEEHKNDSASESTGSSDTGTGSTTDAEVSAGSGTGGSTSNGTEAQSSAGVETGEGETTGPMATTSGGPGDSSTTGSSAFCGDGVINQDFEECDVPSPDPEGPCTAVCQRERIIFVLSISVKGNLSGLQGADAYCKSQATMAMKADPSSPIKDPNNFKALLSSSKETVFERHFRGEGPYRLVNGLTVSDSFDALFTPPLQNPINVDEFGHTRNIAVWTATTIDGQPYPGIDFCSDWESNKGSSSYGWSDAIDSTWIDAGDEVIDNPTTDCYDNSALYCVEQE